MHDVSMVMLMLLMFLQPMGQERPCCRTGGQSNGGMLQPARAAGTGKRNCSDNVLVFKG